MYAPPDRVPSSFANSARAAASDLAISSFRLSPAVALLPPPFACEGDDPFRRRGGGEGELGPLLRVGEGDKGRALREGGEGERSRGLGDTDLNIK